MEEHREADGDQPAEVDGADDGADTGMFRAFVEGAEEPHAEGFKAVGVRFRIVTLIGGLVALAVVVWLLLQ